MIREKIKAELDSISPFCKDSIATVGTTARESLQFTVLPRRKALGFEAINFLVSTIKAAEECLTALDGSVKYIFVDVESKKDIILEDLARKIIKKSILVPYKPNDTTVEAADLFLLNYWDNNIRGKKILIYGAGNIGGKLSLRLAERGAQVYLHSRNLQKTESLVHAFNLILPKFSTGKIFNTKSIKEYSNYFDGVISFISAERIISESLINSLNEKALILDGGINNFTSQFYKKATKKELNCYRLDVRLAFIYSLIPHMGYVKSFFSNIQGRGFLLDINVVSGGAIGNSGDIVVDSLRKPLQVLGVANGIGGLKDPDDFTLNEKDKIEKLQKFIISINHLKDD